MLNGSAFGLPPAPPHFFCFRCSFRRLSDGVIYNTHTHIYIYIVYIFPYHLNAILQKKRGSQMCVTFLVASD